MGQATTIPGVTNQRDKVSYFSVPVLPVSVYSGQVTGTGNGYIQDASALWSNDQFNGANGPHYIHFASGAMVDVLDTTGNNRRLTYPGSLPASVTLGMPFQIRKHLTLEDLFGPNNEAGLLAGQNPASSDNVVLPDPISQKSTTLFYSSVPGFTGWYKDDYSPAIQFVIYPEQGLMVRRKVAGDVRIVVEGLAVSQPISVPVFPGFNLLGTLKASSSLTLSALQIVTGNAATGLAPADNPADGDNLILLNPDGSSVVLFYSNFPGFEGWFDGNFIPANQQSIAPGTAFGVHRKAPRGTFHWTIPE